MSRLNPDVITLGDWQQPAEDRYQLSPAMLEVVLEMGFPVLIVERSPLLLRDMDLLPTTRPAWGPSFASCARLTAYETGSLATLAKGPPQPTGASPRNFS